MMGEVFTKSKVSLFRIAFGAIFLQLRCGVLRGVTKRTCYWLLRELFSLFYFLDVNLRLS